MKIIIITCLLVVACFAINWILGLIALVLAVTFLLQTAGFR